MAATAMRYHISHTAVQLGQNYQMLHCVHTVGSTEGQLHNCMHLQHSSRHDTVEFHYYHITPIIRDIVTCEEAVSEQNVTSTQIVCTGRRASQMEVKEVAQR